VQFGEMLKIWSGGVKFTPDSSFWCNVSRRLFSRPKWYSVHRIDYRLTALMIGAWKDCDSV
jgi:hypothetical protein